MFVLDKRGLNYILTSGLVIVVGIASVFALWYFANSTIFASLGDARDDLEGIVERDVVGGERLSPDETFEEIEARKADLVIYVVSMLIVVSLIVVDLSAIFYLIRKR
jgi:hypothetical protein